MFKKMSFWNLAALSVQAIIRSRRERKLAFAGPRDLTPPEIQGPSPVVC
jgi:hypothetical protein